MSGGDKIEELGGGLCNCFAGGLGDVCLICYFYPCIISRSLEEAGEGDCALNFLLLCCLPCIWFPVKANDINEKLGGDEDLVKRLLLFNLCAPCYGPCALCQFKRAIDKGKSTGLFTKGAPQLEEMEH